MIIMAVICGLFWAGLARFAGLWWPLCLAIGIGVFTIAWLAMALFSVGAGKEKL
jgi:hypothetical protein